MILSYPKTRFGSHREESMKRIPSHMQTSFLRTAQTIAVVALLSLPSFGDVPIAPLASRFQPNADGISETTEVPDFQKHVSPLLGRLGCNGRACHGSFQGQGGFTLSLFGYDFDADLKALLDKEAGRVDVKQPLESKIL